MRKNLTFAENIADHKLRKHSKSFSKYTIIGVIWTILNTFLMWVFIDFLKFETIYAASAIVFFLFISKFYAYRFIKLIENKFIQYASAVIGIYVANVILIWLLVDIVGLSALISSIIIVPVLFIVRFIIFNAIGIIKE